MPKFTLTFDPVTQSEYGSSSHHPQLTCEFWMWLGKNCSQYCVHKVFYTECQSWPWPLHPWPKMNRVPPLTIHNLHVKFESDWAKTVVAIVPTRSYTQSAKLDLDLWPHDPKWIGFLLSSFTTYMWSLKVIGQKLCPQAKRDRRTHPRMHSLTQPSTNGHVIITLIMQWQRINLHIWRLSVWIPLCACKSIL